MLKNGLSMKNICKAFSGVQVLDHVSLEIAPGEVHALLGENGAGKSTLMKILTGIYTCDTGEIYRDGEVFQVKNPTESRKMGISMIHQELNAVNELTVAENVFLGSWPVSKTTKFVDFKEMTNRAQTILDSLNMSISSTAKMGSLSVAQQQMVEIARAVSFNAEIVIMDEPTSSLTNVEIEGLMSRIRELKSQGISIIYISHKMDEIFAISDRATVLRDGKVAGMVNISETNEAELVRLMVGRDLSKMFDNEIAHGSEESILEAINLENRNLKGVSFELKRGEILGIYGLVGAGRSELARALFGIDAIRGGEIKVSGQSVSLKGAGEAVRAGISLVPEDRKRDGLILGQSVRANLSLPVVYKFIKNLRVDRKGENALVEKYKSALSIKFSTVDQLCRNLSGGNQQKVVISKWLATEPKILILDEPTRGIDIGAKSEIYKIMLQLVQSGLSIIMISSELPEILNLSSRIMVMHEGSVTAIMDNSKDVTSDLLLRAAIGEAV